MFTGVGRPASGRAGYGAPNLGVSGKVTLLERDALLIIAVALGDRAQSLAVILCYDDVTFTWLGTHLFVDSLRESSSRTRV